MKKLDIQGNSGCSIKLINDHYILKSTNDISYINRLMNQANKQIEEYNNLINNQYIKVPKIYDVVKNDTYASILMEYIPSNNFIEFFEQSTTNNIELFINCILSYIDDELKLSKIENVNKTIFIDKIIDVKEKCKQNKLKFDYIIFDKVIDYINSFNTDYIQIPVGKCHGDLTLSNICFADNEFYLIDFLDTFLDTPIQDIIKLRQDTKYYWSLCFYNKKYNSTKIINYLNYIDNKIVNYKFYIDIDKSVYDLFEFINLFRLLPYSKNNDILQFIITSIDKKFNEKGGN